MERQFKAVCTWKTGEIRSVELYEEVRAFLNRGETWGKLYYGMMQDADEFEQEWWDKNQSNKRFLESYLYPGNLKEVLPYGKLQNSGLEEIAAKACKLNVNKFITTFHMRPWVEYLAKAGLTELVADIVRIHDWYSNPKSICAYGQSLQGALQLDGNRVARMKQLNGGLNTLEWLQYEEEAQTLGRKIKVSQESLEYLNRKKIYKEECQEILEELKSVNRMVNYMKKQKVEARRLTQIWKDYLRMASEEGMDTTDDIVRLPKDLKARHDQLVELINARRDAKRMEQEKQKYQELDRKILQRLPEVKRYFWEDEEYMIIPAGKCEELIKEGRILHHCVGSSDRYMRRMAEGTSWICFLRKKEELEKPYYTIEIEMATDKILQWYAEFDRRPEKEKIREVLETYKKSIRRQKDMRIQIAAMA